MDLLIGSIKHKEIQDIYPWIKSASRHIPGKKILICLDDIIPESIKEVTNLGFELVYRPTSIQSDINISKFERHFFSREYLKEYDNQDTVLLTDTLDVIFQADPFKWYKENKNNKVLLTSEGIVHGHEPWNMTGIIKAFQPIAEEIKNNDVLNSGIIMGEVGYVKDILLSIYTLTINVKPEHTEGIDQPALNTAMLSNTLKEITQITTTSENFAVNCAVAGPTPQFESWGFKNNYKYDLPSFESNLVINKDKKPYCIVHQYNRIHEWDSYIKNKYKYKPISQLKEDTAVVVCTQPLSSYHDDWKRTLKFDNDDYMLCNIQNDSLIDPNILLDYVQDNVVNYTIDNLRKELNFYLEPSDKHWWNNGGGRNIVWFYPHFRMMYFYKIFPDYRYYWFFDDDVTFPNNDLYKFVDAHKNLNHDCMITYLFSDIDAKNESGVLTMTPGMGSFHSNDYNWLSHYPGPGDNHPSEIKEKYGSYFPLVRLSNEALSVLVEEHENGYFGYSEGYVPTILNYRGLKLYSIFNKESKIIADESLQIHHRRYEDLVWKHV